MSHSTTLVKGLASLSKSGVIVSRRSMSLAVRYHKHGPGQEVYKLEKVDDAALNTPLGANDVSLKFLAAPINPSDFNLAAGTYGTHPPLPAVGGNEGVAVVEKVGHAVKNVKVGDWVLPATAPFGTWRQYARTTDSNIVRIPNDIPPAYAATIAVNPGTAYRLLRDFEQLKPGDVIIQNGANSMVGQAVVQLAREMGVKTINIIRAKRPGVDETLRLLTVLGGDINIPDSNLNTPSFEEIVKELPPIKLALNSIGGESTTNLARALAPGGSLVTYGRMGREPVSIPYDLLNYKQLKLKGFWISKWFDTHSVQEREEMLADIAKSIRTKQLSFFYEMYDFDDFNRALYKAEQPYRLRKIVMNMDYPDRMKEHDARPAKDYERFDTYAY